MLDKSAIETLRDLAFAEQTTLELLKNPKALSSQLVLPKDYVVIDTERYEAQPNKFRGNFNTHLINEFTDYVNNNGDEATNIFVDHKKTSALAIIDMGNGINPQWGNHKAHITLKKTPEFAKLLELKDKELDQLGFIDFIEDWPESIIFLESGDEDKGITLNAAISSIRKLSINRSIESTTEAGDFSASQSATDLIELKAQGNTPPKGFNFNCTPYEGLNEITLKCRLRAITNGKEVKLKYRILAFDRVINDLAIEFKDTLAEQITIDGKNFYCGNMEYQK